MSRIGRKPIDVPANVQVDIEGVSIRVRGPRGELQRSFNPEMKVLVQTEDGRRSIVVERPTDQPRHRALHGLTRALLANMVTGVVNGFRRELTIEGTGYRAEIQGSALVLQMGYSHPVKFEPPTGITYSVDRSGRNIVVEGPDKELVGELAARIRRVRPPEPYLGKGIRYVDEHIRRKAGKAGR
ncbi:MAG: 50S ribosomal protein L6 [Anaerolineae bacterium]